MKYGIKERELKELFEVLKGIKGIHKKSPEKLERFIGGVWYIARSGCQWRLLPPSYGDWRAVHSRFKSWSDRGIWEAIFETLQKEPDMEHLMIDGTIVRAHACSAGYGKNSQEVQALGRSRGGFTTKIHALVDALGNPLRLTLTAGQRHDITQAESLTVEVPPTILIADKGYDNLNSGLEEIGKGIKA